MPPEVYQRYLERKAQEEKDLTEKEEIDLWAKDRNSPPPARRIDFSMGIYERMFWYALILFVIVIIAVINYICN